ncbi:MAG: radical SAM protein [Candidatus Omnitrophica bacterium]|nr:radical SAM protein [Candidatus Omnitrophota bacterium]
MDTRKKNKQIENYLKSCNQFSESILDYTDIAQLTEIFQKRNTIKASPAIVKNLWDQFLKQDKRAAKDIHFYLHIPFCGSRCTFCHNPSSKLTNKKALDDYLKNIEEEMRFYSSTFSSIKFSKLSIGGGTPNILSDTQIEKLLSNINKYFKFQDKCIKEVEFNPRFTSLEKLYAFKNSDFNRISFGVQTLHPAASVAANRSYTTYELVKNSVTLAKKAGFININLDLILGFAQESYPEFEKNLIDILKLEPFRTEIYVLRPPNQKYLNTYFDGDKTLFYKHQQSFVNNFLTNAGKIIKKIDLNYVMGDPWGTQNDAYNDPLSRHYAYFIFIKNKFNYFSHHKNQFKPISCFGIGKHSQSRIFGEYEITQQHKLDVKKNIYKVKKADLDYEIKKYILKAFGSSAKLNLKSFSKIFNVDFLDKFPQAISILREKKIIEIKDNFLFFIAKDKKEIFTYSMFFLLD